MAERTGTAAAAGASAPRILTEADYPHRVRQIRHLVIPLPDGTRLAARAWMPERAGPDFRVPAILEFVPYRKRDDTAVGDQTKHPYFAGHGYACFRVDLRGSGDSEGLLTDEYTPQEQADAVEVIAWLASQEWSSGSVGMMGISWGGFNALQVAARRPPALRAIISACSTDDRYADDIHYMGGCLLNDNPKWSQVMFTRLGRAPDVQNVAAAPRMWRERLEALQPWLIEWLSHQRRDGYWKQGSGCEDYAAIACPVFLIGGWADGYTNAIPRLLQGLRVPRLAWIGPWGHNWPHMGRPGPAAGFLQEALRWWDRWLKDDRNGIDEGPMLRAYIQEPYPPKAIPGWIGGRWVEERSWPAAGATPLRLHLNAGTLDPETRPAGGRKVLSPLVPGNYGRWCIYGLGPDFPTDQRLVDGGALVWDTAPFAAPMDLLGTPWVTLELSSDRPQAQVVVRLSLVAPDGAATRISYGLLNLSHRDSHETAAPLEPGRRYRVRVKLNDLGQRVAPGYRLRLAVATSYWPIAWPSPEAAVLDIATGVSVLDLPVRQPLDGDGAWRPQAEVVQPVPLEPTRDKPQTEERRVETDLATGVTTSHVREDSGTVLHDETGWTTHMRTEQEYAIHPDDPLSARASFRGWQSCARGDWKIETSTRTTLTADRTHFRLESSLSAREAGELVFERSWDLRIPRDHL